MERAVIAVVKDAERVARGWLACLLVSAVLIAVYYALPSVAQHILYVAIGYGAVAVIAYRVLSPSRHTEDRLSWVLLGLGTLAFVIADQVWDLYLYGRGVESPFPSLADAFYIGAYPLLVAGVALLARRQRSRRDWSNVLDGAVVATGLGAIAWVYLVEPLASNPALSGLGRAIAVSYPLADVLVVWVLAELAFAGGLRTPARRLLALSFACLLISDVAYSFALLGGTYRDGTAIDLGWLASYVLLAAAALHPSAARAPDTPLEGPAPLTRGRVALLCAVALVGLVVLAVESAGDRTVDVAVLAASSAVLVTLVIARLSGMTTALVTARDDLRGAVARERSLRDAAAALAGAADRESIERVASEAAQRLLSDPQAVTTICTPDGVARGAASGLAIPLGGIDDGEAMCVRTASRPGTHTRAALEALASQVGLALQRARLAEQVARQAVADERLHLARDVHDIVSHGLSAIVMTAAGCRRAAPGDASRALEGLGEVEVRGREAMGEMRRLVALLRDTRTADDLTPPGLGSVALLVQRTRDTGVDVELVADGPLPALAASVEQCAYRIVQEGLTNTLKHAGPGSRVTVTLRCGASSLEIVVDDDGPAGDAPAAELLEPAPGDGHGLVGIRERAAGLGGVIAAGPRPGGGFVLRALLPIESAR